MEDHRQLFRDLKPFLRYLDRDGVGRCTGCHFEKVCPPSCPVQRVLREALGPETEEEWVERMISLEEEFGPFPPGGFGGGVGLGK